VSEFEGASPQQLEWQRMAAECAVCYVENGMVVGLGTGSTAAFAVRRIGHLVRAGRLAGIVGVPTSRRVEVAAREHGIPIRTLDEEPVVDVTIDGADQVDPNLNLIKGRGGAMLREKVVARASRCEIIVVDEGKLVPRLGAQGLLPVEVVPFGWSVVAREIAGLGVRPVRRIVDGEPVLTDEGNYILDCRLDGIADPASLDLALHAIPGVVEHGLFLGVANMVVVAGRDGLRLLRSGETSCRDEKCYRYATGRDR
jgi:ribose 5-phosphate isomerase A